MSQSTSVLQNRYERFAMCPAYPPPSKADVYGVISIPLNGTPRIVTIERSSKNPQLVLPGTRLKLREFGDPAKGLIRLFLAKYGIDIQVGAKIGNSLWLPCMRDGVVTSSSCAMVYQVFLKDANQLDCIQRTTLIDSHSIITAPVAGIVREHEILERRGIMLLDGLSVESAPFYSGKILPEIRQAYGRSPLTPDTFSLIDSGNYFAIIKTRHNERQVSLHYRLNYLEPEGRFVGSLERLAS